MKIKKPIEQKDDFFNHYDVCEKCGPFGLPKGAIVFCKKGNKLFNARLAVVQDGASQGRGGIAVFRKKLRSSRENTNG